MDTKEIKRRAAESYRILAEIVLANAGLEAVNHAAEESLYWRQAVAALQRVQKGA